MRMLISSIIVCLLISFHLDAQEVIVGLNFNPVAEEYYRNYAFQRKSEIIDTLELPFIDDFSDSFVEPDNSKWADKHAFINSNYPVSPVSVGVATLDALDYRGSHYPNASSVPYVADLLTTHPVNLAYLPADSIYLSFFYQPQGLGEMPDPQDSLCLDFFAPAEMEWNNVWSVPGTPNKDFERVMIKISDEKYLKKGFRFRFRNYASLPAALDQTDRRANVDHWHIDYVILDKNRRLSDTVLRDVAFIEPLLPILKDYELIPWAHFQQAYNIQRKPFIQIKYINHDSITRNVTRTLRITNTYDGHTYSPIPTANDVNSGGIVDFSFPYDYPFNFGVGDSAEFLIQTILGTDAFDFKPNDTLVYRQKFHDYYALDDGTAEAGYGLRGEGTKNASVAVKFNTFRSDTLRAVDMYFNQLPDSLNLNYYFYMNVWDNNNGRPGNLRYSQIGVRPVYTDSLNRFHRYALDSVISVTDTFYIGWTQTVDKLLNLGFDRNRINNHRIYYTSGGTWNTSAFQGSLMLRPVVSMAPIVYSTRPLPYREVYMVYPNPAKDFLVVESGEPYFGEERYLNITDLSGRVLIQENLSDRSTFDVSVLKNGMYLVSIRNKAGYVLSMHKIMIYK